MNSNSSLQQALPKRNFIKADSKKYLKQVFQKKNIEIIRQIVVDCTQCVQSITLGDALMFLFAALFKYVETYQCYLNKVIQLPQEFDDALHRVRVLRFELIEHRKECRNFIERLNLSIEQIIQYIECLYASYKFQLRYEYSQIYSIWYFSKIRVTQGDAEIYEIIEDFKESPIPGSFIAFLCKEHGLFSTVFCEEIRLLSLYLSLRRSKKFLRLIIL